jgi:processive 1,2-diacylglycerol beta-glucosyltransferase
MLESLIGIRHEVQIVVICGKNADLQKRMAKVALGAQLGRNPVHVVGFTTEMDEYMAASDLLVGKPGGLTTSEALARGLVMVVVNPIPGQEERNSDHLLEEGAAIRCNNLPVLAYKIDRLLDEPDRLARLQANVKRIARPRAAFEIVEKTRELTKR